MPVTTLLIANRGEIAIRIARSAAELGIRTIAVHSEDDAAALHVRKADQAVALPATGAAAYLDIAGMVAAARAAGADAIHPGYGFLSENRGFAVACAEAGITFVGPTSETLAICGDKAQARALAQHCGVPVLPGIPADADPSALAAFLAAQPAGQGIMIKAAAGGGGRGMRPVFTLDEVPEAAARCRSEAERFFGNGALYAERLLKDPRHVEVQIIGDGTGQVAHLWERDCTLQRRGQKLVEIAPSPTLSAGLRGRLLDAAVRLARELRYLSLGTFEFLLDGEEFYFIECNPRLQVEHTVTEEVTGIDLVAAQLKIATGAQLAALRLTQDRIPAPYGHAIQLRVNMETMGRAGQVLPATGTLSVFEPPAGRGIRVDHFGYAGYRTSTRYDSLLAKLIVHSDARHFAEALEKSRRALREFRIEGVKTNISFLRSLLRHPAVIANEVSTNFIADHIAELTGAAGDEPDLYFAAPAVTAPAAAQSVAAEKGPATAPPGTVAVPAPMSARIVSFEAAAGQRVRDGAPVAVIEAMKSELVVNAPQAGIVHLAGLAAGAQIIAGDPLLFLEPVVTGDDDVVEEAAVDLDAIRPDLAEVMDRHAVLRDENRPDAVARRRRIGMRTARENIADLVDADSFTEYGGLTLAMQRSRRSVEELISVSPADGFVAGIGSVNGAAFPGEKSRCMVLAYDYMVFAGTQGFMAHRKKDRMFELAWRLRTPLILFSEGGGGRPGDTDYVGAGGLELRSFWHFSRLSGLVPMIGVNAGRCFAGNAALLGCCDVIIATRNSTIGMAGPAMIEGGGLGTFTPEQVGPVSVQEPNGVIDVLVEDEAEAIVVAKQYLSYFQGPIATHDCADQRLLRPLVPENRLRAYDIRAVIETLADTGSVLELRKHFGVGIVTAFARVAGNPIGIIANNPLHLGGAVDAPGADKAARFMQLCDAFDIPLLMLCDTPGFMVGPETEKTATVRHFARMFVTAAGLDVPFFTVVLRKAYGLGAQAMTGGYLNSAIFSVSWPTGEVGPMGLEGAVQLAYRKELAAIADPAERQARYQDYVDELYTQGKALNAASFVEIDDVIDPADTRGWIVAGLKAAPAPAPRTGKKRPMVDTW